ncbi:MAG: hypothetical protein OXC60_08390 [Litoreibacter sp.]|nr:hypothetical protein [Litoreibacter sp.]
MKRPLIWILALVLGLPLVLAMWGAFFLFAVFPLQHVYNTWRMDAKTAKLWETAEAQVITLSAQLASDAGGERIENRIICYNGHFARPFTLKAGAPFAGNTPRSVGEQALIAQLPTGGVLDVDFPLLCNRIMRGGIGALVQDLTPNDVYIVAPSLEQQCAFPREGHSSAELLRTEAFWVSRPEITTITTQRLRDVVPLDALGSTDTRQTPARFSERWTWAQFEGDSKWKPDENCWAPRGLQCNAELTRICGGAPG